MHPSCWPKHWPEELKAKASELRAAAVHAETAPKPVGSRARDLAVVIPSRKVENLFPCIAALRAHEPDARVVVVDDGLDKCLIDGDWLTENAPIEVLAGVDPFVYARNCNLGIGAAGRADIVLMNDDALLETLGGLTGLQKQWIAHPEFGMVSASVDYCGTPAQIHREGAALREESRMVAFICVFIPRSTVERVGLLDERFAVNAGGEGERGYGLEDDDYSWRVRQAGLKLGVWDGCLVNHTTLKSTFRDDPEHPWNVLVHEKLFAEKWGRHPRL